MTDEQQQLLAIAQAEQLAMVVAQEQRHRAVIAAQAAGVSLYRLADAMGLTASAVRYVRDHPPGRMGPRPGATWSPEHRASFLAAIDRRWAEV